MVLCPPMAEQRFRPSFIRAWRKHRGLTMDQLAADIGISVSQLSSVERGEQPYTQRTLESLASALDCRAIDLLATDPNGDQEQVELLRTIDGMTPEKRRLLHRIAKTLEGD